MNILKKKKKIQSMVTIHRRRRSKQPFKSQCLVLVIRHTQFNKETDEEKMPLEKEKKGNQQQGEIVDF